MFTGVTMGENEPFAGGMDGRMDSRERREGTASTNESGVHSLVFEPRAPPIAVKIAALDEQHRTRVGRHATIVPVLP